MKKNSRGAGPLVLSIIIFLALIFVIYYCYNLLCTCDYFKINDIVSKDGNVTALSYLKGKNIFSVNLKRESRYISGFFPECSDIRLVRLLPKRIFADFIKRKAVAQVKLYRYFNLDDEGVLFYPGAKPPEPDLPVIFGLETKIFGPKPGTRYNIKEVALCLNIIKEINRNRGFKDYKIRKIDVANPASASVTIYLPTSDASLEVKLGADNIKDNIKILSGLVTLSKDEMGNIKYMDLRFKEPVIKLKDAK